MLTHVDNRITYNGNGNATEFAYQFKILDRTDIKVLLTDADGKEKLLTKDYYVDVEKNVVRYPGYAVGAEVPESERPPVLPTGWKLTIYREVPVTQETDLPDQYPFNQVEDIGDKLTMIAQQLTDVTGRSLKIGVSTSADIDTTIPFEAGKSFRIADDGKSIVLTEDPAIVLPLVQSLADAAAKSESNAKSYMDVTKGLSENVNVFTPSVSEDGILSWTNKAGLPNPPSVNIKGKDGADGGVTVDENLSATSTNPLQNRAVYDLSQSIFSRIKGVSDDIPTKVSVLENDAGYIKTVNNTKPDSNGNVTIAVSGGSDITVDSTLSSTSTNPVQNKVINAALDNKLGIHDTALYARMDSAGYVIANTYVRSVNGVAPDSYGNVAITASGGSGTNITVDSALSSTSTNPVQNRVIYTALTNKLDKTGTALKATKDDAGNTISTTYAKKTDISGMVKSVNGTKPDASGNVSIAVSGGSNVTVDTTLSATSTNAIQNKAVYAALSDKLDKSDVAIGAQRALQDGDGNIISLTYVKSVNGTKPDSNGNVSISTSGGDGGGASTSTQNTWTALQNFHDLMLNREKYTTYVVNGTSDKPVTSTMVYAVIGAFTLDLATSAGLLSASQSSVFTAYFAANADYSLTINNAGKLKYVGSASDIAITSAGLLLNIWMSKDGEGTLTSIVQASKLS